jgi:hypothetical protein
LNPSATQGTEGSTQMGDYIRRTRRKRPSTYSACRSSREQRRALEMLAGTPRGLTEHFLLGHGFSVEMLSRLVLAKLRSTERGFEQASRIALSKSRFYNNSCGARSRTASGSPVFSSSSKARSKTAVISTMASGPNAPNGCIGIVAGKRTG